MFINISRFFHSICLFRPIRLFACSYFSTICVYSALYYYSGLESNQFHVHDVSTYDLHTGHYFQRYTQSSKFLVFWWLSLLIALVNCLVNLNARKGLLQKVTLRGLFLFFILCLRFWNCCCSLSSTVMSEATGGGSYSKAHSKYNYNNIII